MKIDTHAYEAQEYTIHALDNGSKTTHTHTDKSIRRQSDVEVLANCDCLCMFMSVYTLLNWNIYACYVCVSVCLLN